MTTFIAWISVDERAPAALYFASDSRITWGAQHRWDAGRKLFACRAHPDFFGYVGDVTFPSIAISQLVDAADSGQFFSAEAKPSEKHQLFVTSLQQSLENSHSTPTSDFQIFHASREGEGLSAKYFLWRLSYVRLCKVWTDEQIKIDTAKSNLILAAGTGEKIARRENRSWTESSQGGTSRAIFGAFCDALKSGHDPASGGAPQLVGIYPRWPSQIFGVIFSNKRYVYGLELKAAVGAEGIEWRDELFQRMDGETLLPLKGAQRHFRY